MKSVIQMIFRLNAIVKREITAMQIAVAYEAAAGKRNEVKTLVMGMTVTIGHRIIHQIRMVALYGYVIKIAVLDGIALIADACADSRREPLAGIYVNIFEFDSGGTQNCCQKHKSNKIGTFIGKTNENQRLVATHPKSFCSHKSVASSSTFSFWRILFSSLRRGL